MKYLLSTLLSLYAIQTTFSKPLEPILTSNKIPSVHSTTEPIDRTFIQSNINLQVLVSDTTYLNETICDNSSFTVGSSIYNTAGSYQDNLINQSGNDSIVFLNLQTVASSTTYYDTIIAQSCSYIINNQTYFSDGNIIDTLNSQFGCDSIVFYNLTFNYEPIEEAFRDTTYNKIVLGTFMRQPEVITSTDFDFDLDEDIVVFSHTDGLKLLENTGDLHFKPIKIPTSFENIIDLEVKDYENDGDIDIVITYLDSITPKQGLIRNDVCQFTDHTLNTQPVNKNVQFADMDNDGDLDKIEVYKTALYHNNTVKITTYQDGLEVYDTNFTLPFLSAYDGNCKVQFKIDDFNGDSLPEIVISKENQSVSAIFIIQNDIDSGYVFKSIYDHWSRTEYGQFAKDFHITDIDQDGDKDIIYTVSTNSNVKYHIRYALNDGQGNFETHHISNSGGVNVLLQNGKDKLFGHFGPATDNFNYQNEYEISVHNNGVKLIKRDSTLRSWASGAWPKRASSHIQQVDFDGDNDLDFFLISPEGAYMGYYENINDTNFIANLSFNEYLKERPYKITDVDQDGDQDILFNQGFEWRENIGGSFNEKTNLYTLSPNNTSRGSKKIIDLDSDGNLDLLLMSLHSDTLFVYKHAGNNHFNLVNYYLTDDKNYSLCQDFDNDGDLDLLYKTYWLENNDGFSFETENYPNSIRNPNVLKDINNDGYKDVLCKYGDTISWFINNGFNEYNEEQVIDTDAGNYESDLKVIDFENDGDLDIISIESNLFYDIRYNALLYQNKLNSPETTNNTDTSNPIQPSFYTVYPNPNNGVFNINSTLDHVRCVLTNTLGQIVYQRTINKGVNLISPNLLNTSGLFHISLIHPKQKIETIPIIVNK